MKVLHIVDSLNVGGRERMAVNITNALNDAGVNTILCISRTSGCLSKFISNEKIIVLNRKKTFDIIAIFRLISYVKKNKIDIIHAHDASFFLGIILKAVTRVKLIWHDHFGLSEMLANRPSLILKISSKLFDHTVVVNSLLYDWSKNILKTNSKKLTLLNNFATLTNEELSKPLPGRNKISIVCVANFRPQKDHLNLLKAFHKVDRNDLDLYLIGSGENDEYYLSLKKYISDNKLENVYFLGVRTDISAILKKCQIGIISSLSEGLPVSILEYGLAGLSVICTNVGQCNKVISSRINGILVSPNNHIELANAIATLANDENLRKEYSEKFHENITQNYSSQSFVKQLMKIYNNITTSGNNFTQPI